MCAWMIDAYGNDEQRSHWVPKLASMEVGRRIELGKAVGEAGRVSSQQSAVDIG